MIEAGHRTTDTGLPAEARRAKAGQRTLLRQRASPYAKPLLRDRTEGRRQTTEGCPLVSPMHLFSALYQRLTNPIRIATQVQDSENHD